MTQPYPGPQQQPQQGYGYPQQPGPAHPQPAAPRPLHKMKRIYAGGLFLLLIGTGCGAMGSDENTKTAGSARPGPTVTATVTATETVTARPTAPAKKTPADNKAPAPASTIEMGTLPSLVGMNHQDAQDTAQAAGFYNLREKDNTGMDRLLLMDRNWKVCKQEPAPGKHAVEKTITLYSVKDTESC